MDVLSAQSEFDVAKYALANYDNPHCKTLDEFEEDLQRFVYIKKLLNRDDYNPRLVLNHIIILYNVFRVEACTKLLFAKTDKQKWPELKTYLTFLNYMPDEIIELGIVNNNIPYCPKITEELRNI